MQVTESFEAGVVSFKEQRSVIRESSEACVLPAGRGAHTVALQVTGELLRQEEWEQRGSQRAAAGFKRPGDGTGHRLQ